MTDGTFTLVDARRRKYLAAARAHPKPGVQTLARTLAMTGCRVSEALAIRACDVDLEASERRISTDRSVTPRRRTHLAVRFTRSGRGFDRLARVRRPARRVPVPAGCRRPSGRLRFPHRAPGEAFAGAGADPIRSPLLEDPTSRSGSEVSTVRKPLNTGALSRMKPRSRR